MFSNYKEVSSGQKAVASVCLDRSGNNPHEAINILQDSLSLLWEKNYTPVESRAGKGKNNRARLK